jgi:hypothetical protein
MKSPDAEARELARILIDAAQIEQDSGNGMMVPASVIRQLRIVPPIMPGPVTLDEARRRLGIPLAIFEQELRHHLLVWEIVHGAAGHRRRGCRAR